MLAMYVSCQKVRLFLVVSLFLLLNWVSFGLYLRYDLSQTGRLRLTSSTKKLLKELPGTVTLEAFISEEVPDIYLQPVQQLKDFLKEYASASKGKLKLIFLDPDTDPDALERANQLSVQRSQIGVQGKGDFQIKTIYLALVISHGNTGETIENLLNVRILEYDLTSRIHKMVYPRDRSIALLAGHGQFTYYNLPPNIPGLPRPPYNPARSLKFLNSVVSPAYGSIKLVDTSQEDIPSDVTTLLVVGPNKLSDLDQFKIDQFIMQGGNVLFAVSGLNIELQRGSTSNTDSSVIDFIKHYGFEIEYNMILEPKSYLPIRKPAPGNPFLVQRLSYPVWLVIPNEGLGQDNIITEDIPGLLFPWSSSIKLNQGRVLPNLEDNKKSIIQVLAHTSTEARASDKSIMIDPRFLQVKLDEYKKKEGTKQDLVNEYGAKKRNIASHVYGAFFSFFQDKKLPQKASSANYMKSSQNNAHLMVLGTPYFLTDTFLQQAGQGNMGNLPFLISSIDVMNGLDELVASRRKNVSDPVLPDLQPWEQKIWTILNFLIPLMAIFSYALMRFIRRKRLESKVYNYAYQEA